MVDCFITVAKRQLFKGHIQLVPGEFLLDMTNRYHHRAQVAMHALSNALPEKQCSLYGGCIQEMTNVTNAQ